MSDKMRELVDQLNTASDAYYNKSPIMSDLEFNELRDELEKLEYREGVVLPNSPTRTVGAPAVDSLPKFTHPYPALSLDKTKDIDLFVSKFEHGVWDSGGKNENVVVMYKEDGATAQAYYNHGRLEKLVTRGNGEIGNVVTHIAKNIEGLPLEIAYEGVLVVRGEVLMSYAEFDRVNETQPIEDSYKNPRNLASATLTMLDSSEAASRHLNIKAFNLVFIDEETVMFPPKWFSVGQSFAQRLDLLDELGFDTVDRIVCPIEDLKQSMDRLTEGVKDYPYPVDGLVVALDDYKYAIGLRGTEHHPHIMQGYAFKWEDQPQVTTLRGIEWSPSRTGLLNPVAIFDPVEIDGTTVQRASAHNLSIMRKMRLRAGDRITVTKSNLIIPFLVENLDWDKTGPYTDDEVHEMIGFCPTCGAEAIIKKSKDNIETVYCPNEECPEKMIGKFAHFCSRDCMDIQGMSEETIKKLVDAGFIKEYADFFKLGDKLAISFLPGFGKQSWKKMCDAAEIAKNTTFIKFITSLSIPNIGKGQAKTLFKYFSDNYDVLCEFAGLDSDKFDPVTLLRLLYDAKYDFTVIDGFGDIMAQGLNRWIARNFAPGLDSPETRLLDLLTFTDSLQKAVASSISGKSFCITGKLISYPNRQALVEVIEAHGGKWVDSVSSKTDYLINNDTTSTSGKNKKAKDLNIPIISEEDFQKMLA